MTPPVVAPKLPLAERLLMCLGMWTGSIVIQSRRADREVMAQMPAFVGELIAELQALEANTRPRPAVVELSEAMVERAAREFFSYDGSGHAWESVRMAKRDECRRIARAILTAALGATGPEGEANG